ncbi:AlbA family DNA-binding domain-containing protein [Planctomonas psychrotolerans]|uniref:AlbA family DNA-binding domain-containing protein n=1 Tax=Planctomonas psychrotolerans TaxID=2528712 RepID=UPI001238D447|nr:ATP-binding protein [Planctomonas psychrotolerans]
MLSNEEIAAFLEAGYESRAVEFKGAGSTRDSSFVATVARAAIALANQRDGGWVIIGVDEDDIERSGLSPQQLAEWSDYDTVVDKINRFADPPLRIARAARSLPDGRDVLVLQVAEFDDIPILSARDFGSTIQRGRLYTRSFRKPESTSTHTQNEMRAVLELATQKQLARFLQLARGAGVDLAQGPTDEERYDDEMQTFVAGANIDDITQAAFFRYTIRPAGYQSELVQYTDLVPSARRASVSIRGWPYPYIAHPERGPSWVTESNTVMHREAWAAFESGQFASWHRVPENTSDDWNSSNDCESGDRFFPVWMPIAQFTEVMFFALRYQQTIAPDRSLTVQLQLRGAQGWKLVAGDRRRFGFHGEYALATNEWQRTVLIPETAAGTVDARELAVTPSLHLLRRFGWNGVTEQIVRSVQEAAFGEAPSA